MTDFALVHGAWCGGWVFDRLAADLRAHGHRVLVVALAGMGSRAAELNPAITLYTHVDDVCAQIEAAGFERFVLVGHSYGGMVVTGAATRLGGRIDALVYLDAFLPDDGQSLWDLTSSWEHEHYITSQRDVPGLVAPLPGFDHPLLGRHPLLCFLEPVRFTGEEARVNQRHYVYATGWQPTPFTRFADKVRANPVWSYHEADGGHDVMNDQPEQTLAILLNCG